VRTEIAAVLIGSRVSNGSKCKLKRLRVVDTRFGMKLWR
jgi:hypothetical protein